MLSELCRELKNWFDEGQPKIHGEFEISEGKITDEIFNDEIQTNQYFRIIGSVFNDGVYQFTDELALIDEKFDGAIWLMAIPKDIISLNDEIDKWIADYGDIVNGPYSSESFGGYSYSKQTGKSSGGVASWQYIFSSKLNLWRKI